jgi:thiamine biosynthesis lipoprotein
MKKNKAGQFIFLLILLAGMMACTPKTGTMKIRFFGEAQGTYYAITYFAEDTLVTQQQIDSLLEAFDLSASIWVKESVISRVNNNDPEVVPDRDFINIFRIAQKVSAETDGAFDITVGPLVEVWGFGFENRADVDRHMVDSLLPLVNYRAVRIENGSVVKDNPGIQIDYNAIAQGYSVDLTGDFLRKNGIGNFLIDIGGELLAEGTKPNGELWVVGIEKPSKEMDSERQLKATLKITGKAVATSGNYRKYYEIDGVRYSHTINPKTGYPVKHSLLSATVIADSAAYADAYATAFMVMGLEKAKAFLAMHPELEAFFIYQDKDKQMKTFATKGIADRIIPQ